VGFVILKSSYITILLYIESCGILLIAGFYGKPAVNMSCPAASDCTSASTCTHHHTNGTTSLEDIEDYKTELATLRTRTRELEDKLVNLSTTSSPAKTLRSSQWMNRSDDKAISALYLDRYLNYGLTLEELMSGRPIIGIANSGSDLAPCNQHHVVLAKRVREGIRSAGGIAIEFRECSSTISLEEGCAVEC